MQYSQRDPLYQGGSSDIDKKYTVNKRPAYHYNQHSAPQSHSHHQTKYVILKEPEPIIEIIVQESNDTLPTAAPLYLTGAGSGNRPREPVQVFYVKYKKDEHGDGVVYDTPVAAVTPAAPLEPIVEEPAPTYGVPNYPVSTPAPSPSTTLRSIIHPDSEKVHVSTGGLKITFGNKDVEHSYKTKRQQPHPGVPTPRFNSAAFPPSSHFTGSQPDYSQQNRFLAPPPTHNSRNSPPPPFFTSFSRQNLPQFAGKFDQFQQGPPSFSSGKLEPVPFKQPSTGKIEFFDGNNYNSFPSQFRHQQEPLNGLPPPPPPFQFQRPSFQSPSFSSPSTSFRNQRPSRPFPQAFSSQPQFSQPLQSPQATGFPSRLPQPAPFSSQPPSLGQPQFAQQAPLIPFKPLPTQFTLPPTTTAAPPSTTPPPPPPVATYSQQPSYGSEIVQSLSPSTEELRKQQQDQFRREQEYYLEIQKYNKELKELEQRQKEAAATAKPANVGFSLPTTKKSTQKQFAYPSTTPSPPASTEAPSKVPNNVVLPDEVPDELRQQLLASGILSNADIQILDYDKVGDIPVESLPQEALTQFLGATKGGAASGSAPVPQIVPAPSYRKSDDGDAIAEPSDLSKFVFS